MNIEKYSLGVGDRFGFEGAAQLRALQKAQAFGINIVPVWNKSNREHNIIGTVPEDTRKAADTAVKTCNWKSSYYVDADHIGLETVDRFIPSCNFFTIDVADYIGNQTTPESVAAFVKDMSRFVGTLEIPGIQQPVAVTTDTVLDIAGKYLYAVEEAGKVYRHIAERKGADKFIAEVSFDEANNPQTPAELFFMLAAIAREGIPIQTIAPKFTGSFLKGIDYVGNVGRFAQEFEADLAVVAHAVNVFHLPSNLKLSVHSGSDKFSLYPIMHAAMKKFNSGIHLKTAGTTWLEELIGLAASGGDGLKAAKEIYVEAMKRYDELCKPYLPVIDIKKEMLPTPQHVASWSAEEYVAALQHNQSSSAYNLHLRQLLHVSFKVAAEMNGTFVSLVAECRTAIESNVTYNLFSRHIEPLFLGRSNGGSHD